MGYKNVSKSVIIIAVVFVISFLIFTVLTGVAGGFGMASVFAFIATAVVILYRMQKKQPVKGYVVALPLFFILFFMCNVAYHTDSGITDDETFYTYRGDELDFSEEIRDAKVIDEDDDDSFYDDDDSFYDDDNSFYDDDNSFYDDDDSFYDDDDSFYDDDSSPSSSIDFSSSSSWDGPGLPDPHHFFYEKLNHAEESISGGNKIRFGFDYESSDAAHEYAKLLDNGRYNLNLRTKDVGTFGGDGAHKSYKTFYVYDYTGSDFVDDISQKLDDTRYEAPVIIEIKDWPEFGWCDLIIYCAEDFSFVDNGERCSDKTYDDRVKEGFLGEIGSGGNYSSGGSNSSDNYDNSDYSYSIGSKSTCTFCGGSGKRDCLTCGGEGTVTVTTTTPNYNGIGNSLSGGTKSITKKCPNSLCHNGQVNCTYCGGTGKR